MARKALPDISGIENKINVALYGGKSFFRGVRDSKYRAEVISCGCDNCSFRDKGMCLKVTSMTYHCCEYGRKQIFEGYTPQAAISQEWCHVFRKDAAYNKLSYVPSDLRFGVVGEYYFIFTSYVGVNWNEDGTYSFETTTSPKTHIFLKKSEINTDFLADLLTHKPYALMGGIIKDYQESIVTIILRQMQSLAPELYNTLIEDYPQFGNVVPNFVGKKVYVRTLRGGVDIGGWGNNVFHLSEDRKTITCDNYCSSLLPFGAKTSKLVIEVTDDMTYTVQSNDETCEDTEIAK